MCEDAESDATWPVSAQSELTNQSPFAECLSFLTTFFSQVVHIITLWCVWAPFHELLTTAPWNFGPNSTGSTGVGESCLWATLLAHTSAAPLSNLLADCEKTLKR